MNPPLWFTLWLTLPPSALLSNPDNCIINEGSNPKYDSPLLDFLHCYNDYETQIQCSWREHEGKDLQLWIKTEDESGPCEPYSAAEQNSSEQGITQCRYKTRSFSIGTEHTVFFRDKQNLCSSIRPLDLSQLLRARTPVNLFARDAGDGGWQIGWSSPYPSSSSLNKNISYQLSYRMDTQDIWTTLSATSTRVKLEKQQLILGHRYKARVRARASMGQWSHWSPVVTWKTIHDAGYVPSLHCVLDGDGEVTCSWEVSREVALSISYHLVCRRNQTAPSERCCVSPTVTTNHSRAMQKFSCSLNIRDPEHLQLDLQRTHNSKIFKPNEHIRPNPPPQVEVREEGSSWRVNWIKPRAPPELLLNYQVCYYRIEEQGCAAPLNVSGATTLIIPDSLMVPLQRYKVQVRSLVDPGGDFMYGGIPSKWTDPVEWTSHKATWSLHTLIYCSIGVFVAIVALTLYYTIPACQRKVILWVDSVPSPGKSKILSEIKSVTHWTLKQSESTSFCKVQHSDTISTRYSVASLWVAKDDEGIVLEPDEGCDTGDDLPVPAEEVGGSGTSSMSFSGPYIFCQSLESKKNPEVEMCEEKEKEEEEEEVEETSSDDPVPPSSLNFTIFGEGYVSLPTRSICQSTQDLMSHRSMITNTNRLSSSTELEVHCPESSPWPDQTSVQQCLSEPPNSLQPPAYTSVTFTSWPEGGTIQASGYCRIPTAHI